MRYADIKFNDTANAPGIAVSLYVQGCPHRCPGCFNPETWNKEGGKEFTYEDIKRIIEGLTANGINRSLCILGGEPLWGCNQDWVNTLICEVKSKLPNTKIYIWTGYLFEDLMKEKNLILRNILNFSDYLIDGPFIQEEKDLRLKMRGSRNQRIINLTETLKYGKIIIEEN